MADTQTLDKAYHVIISSLVDTGQAPHYSELATALGCHIEEGRQCWQPAKVGHSRKGEIR